MTFNAQDRLSENIVNEHLQPFDLSSFTTATNSLVDAVEDALDTSPSLASERSIYYPGMGVLGGADDSAMNVQLNEQQEQGSTLPRYRSNKEVIAAHRDDTPGEHKSHTSLNAHVWQPIEPFDSRRRMEYQQEAGAQNEASLGFDPRDLEDMRWLEDPLDLDDLLGRDQHAFAHHAPDTSGVGTCDNVTTYEPSIGTVATQRNKRAAEDAIPFPESSELRPAKLQRRLPRLPSRPTELQHHMSLPHEMDMLSMGRRPDHVLQSRLALTSINSIQEPAAPTQQYPSLETLTYSPIELHNPLPLAIYQELFQRCVPGKWDLDYKYALKDAATTLAGRISEHFHNFAQDAITQMESMHEGAILQLLQLMTTCYRSIFSTEAHFGVLIQSQLYDGSWASQLFRIRGQQPEHWLALETYAEDNSEPPMYRGLKSPPPESYSSFDPATLTLNAPTAYVPATHEIGSMRISAGDAGSLSSGSATPMADHSRNQGKYRSVQHGQRVMSTPSAGTDHTSNLPITSAITSKPQTRLPRLRAAGVGDAAAKPSAQMPLTQNGTLLQPALQTLSTVVDRKARVANPRHPPRSSALPKVPVAIAAVNPTPGNQSSTTKRSNNRAPKPEQAGAAYTRYSTEPPVTATASRAKAGRQAYERKFHNKTVITPGGQNAKAIGVDMTPYAGLDAHDLIARLKTGELSSSKIFGELAWKIAEEYSNQEMAKVMNMSANSIWKGRILKYLEASLKQQGVHEDDMNDEIERIRAYRNVYQGTGTNGGIKLGKKKSSKTVVDSDAEGE